MQVLKEISIETSIGILLVLSTMILADLENSTLSGLGLGSNLDNEIVPIWLKMFCTNLVLKKIKHGANIPPHPAYGGWGPNRTKITLHRGPQMTMQRGNPTRAARQNYLQRKNSNYPPTGQFPRMLHPACSQSLSASAQTQNTTPPLRLVARTARKIQKMPLSHSPIAQPLTNRSG